MNQQNAILTTIPGLPKTFSTNHLERDSSPFSKFLAKGKDKSAYAYTAILILTAQFIAFKILYPFPDFLPDSYNYIDTASQHLVANVWPVGYGKFLWVIHFINSSDTLLVGIQFFLLGGALLYFFYSILHIFHPDQLARNILFTFLFVNPLFLYLSNFILPDALFAALSIIFLTLFFRMFHRPTPSQVIIQGLIIGFAFTIRYTAVYYPLISLVGLLLSKQTNFRKVGGAILGVSLMIPFALYTIQKTKEATGKAQFSILGEWQMANNALYMYEHIRVDSTKLPKEVRALDRVTKQFFTDIPPVQRDLTSFAGAFFLIAPYAPLKQYLNHQYNDEELPTQFQAWGKIAPLYADYGKALIGQYPIAFLKYFLAPNIKNYFLPPLEKFETYNFMTNNVPTTVQDWFDYIAPDIAVVSATFQGRLFYPYRLFFLILNVYFWGSVTWFLFKDRSKKLKPDFRKATILTSCFLLLHFGFSIVASPLVLRFQVFPMIVIFTLCLFLVRPKSVLA
jgi:hypothetical protein